jgi:hypothetical protein
VWRAGRKVETVSADEPHIAVSKVKRNAAGRADEDLVIRVGVLAVAESGSVAPPGRNQGLSSEDSGEIAGGTHRGEVTGRR